jgi:hypothetical protein
VRSLEYGIVADLMKVKLDVILVDGTSVVMDWRLSRPRRYSWTARALPKLSCAALPLAVCDAPSPV